MTRTWQRALAGITLSALGALTLSTAALADPPAKELVGKGTVAADLLDDSGLSGDICKQGDPTSCVSKAIFGGFGSDLAYTGRRNVFIAAPDRGPYDGLTDVPFLDRFHYLRITTDVGSAFPNIDVKLLDTRLLRDGRHRFVGAAGDFEDRLDPEGIRASGDETFYVSDEYGPYVLEFDRRGDLVRRIRIPAKFKIANPSATANTELTGNDSGRQANRGMEGLAISPDSRTLFGIMQNALLQDNGLVPGALDRLGVNNRILQIDLRSGRTKEFVYPIETIGKGQGVSEILAVDDHQFLVLERDNRSNLPGSTAGPTKKQLWLIDIKGATDVSDVASLPAGALPTSIKPVSKTLFLDLLDPAYGLEPTIAEKLEGLAWGPDLRDGRHLLYVISDNDLSPTLPTQIYSFAIARSALPDFKAQRIPEPLYPTGHGRRHD